MKRSYQKPHKYSGNDNIVAEVRRTWGLKQQELADMLKVSISTISFLEHEKGKISGPIEVLCKLLLKDRNALKDIT